MRVKTHCIMAKILKSIVRALIVFTTATMIAGCGGGGNDNSPSPPTNVGGGYTLMVSGGTLNHGASSDGLVILAALRDSAGNGPGAASGWKVTITGPGIGVPLMESYDDSSSASYITWMWDDITPVSGSYTARAGNGITTLTYSFSIDATKRLQAISVTKLGDTVSWNPVTGTGSYYYSVTNGTGGLVTDGYLLPGTTFFTLPFLSGGSYLVEVYAYTTNRIDLMNDTSASPVLSSPENMARRALDFLVGGSYGLDARGGVLYEGATGTAPPTDHFGLAIWTSILTVPTSSVSSPTPPAGDWNVTVTGPGLPPANDVNAVKFKYPATYSHYLYWDYGFVPQSGSYTVTAVSSSGTSTISQIFSVPTTTAKLPIATGITVTTSNGGGAAASWSPVAGAASYYVNIWRMVGSVYTEIAARWVSATSAIIPNGTLTKGVEYDLYVTASTLDMTSSTVVPPPSPGSQVNMSDTVFTYRTFIAQ